MQQDIWTNCETNVISSDARPSSSLSAHDRSKSSSSLVKFGPRNPENRPEKVPRSLKEDGINVLNRQYLIRTLPDCCEIWWCGRELRRLGLGKFLKFTSGQNQNCRQYSTWCEIRIAVSTALPFEPPAFQNRASYPDSETNTTSVNDSPMLSPTLMKIGPRNPENRPEKLFQNWTTKIC